MRTSANFFFICLLIILAFFALVFKNSILAKLNSASVSELAQLRLENESLKAQLNALPSEKDLQFRGLNYRPAIVYSTYPFSDRKVLTISLGSEDGLAVSMPAAISPGILIGQIAEVFPKTSLVQTIFDPNFKMPVRIGNSVEDALLIGGNTPTATLIKRTAAIATGDSVYSAGTQFPYGLEIGKIGFINEGKDSFFKNAELDLGYNFNEAKKIYIITNAK